MQEHNCRRVHRIQGNGSEGGIRELGGKGMSRLYHGLSNHNKWIRKGYPCPYCMKGSKPVHESLLEMNDKQIEAYITKSGNEIRSGDFPESKPLKGND